MLFNRPHNELVNIKISSNCKINSSSYVIVWVEEKPDSCYINFVKKELKNNSIVVLNPGESFSVTSEATIPLKLLYIKNVENKFIKVYLNPWLNPKHLSNPVITLKEHKVLSFKSKIDQLIKLFYDYSNEKNTIISHLLDAVTLDIIDAKIEIEKNIAVSYENLISSGFKKDHLVANYAKKLSIDSKQLLIKLNKLGLNKPHEIIKIRLLIEAKNLLVFSDMPIKEICYEIGFNDPAYFARFFKQQVGVSASKFRSYFLQ